MMISQNTFASQVIEKKLFRMDKNYHSENILIISSHVDENCKFIAKDKDYLDLYWLMNGSDTDRKEIAGAIKSGIQKRVQFEGMSSEGNNFKIRMNDLSELKHDLEDTTIDVKSEISGGVCQVKSILKLGPSSKYRKINLKRFYCEVSTNMIGIPKGCKFVELQGNDIDTGELVKVRYKSK